MKIAYCHNNGNPEFQRGTFAIKLPLKEDLLAVLDLSNHGILPLFKIGAAFVSKKDQLNKKIGREIAFGRMDYTTCWLEETFKEVTRNRTVLHFSSNVKRPNGKLEYTLVPVKFGVSLTPSKELRLLYMYFVGVV